VIILYKTPFTLSCYYHSSEIAKCIMVSHLYKITAGIVTLYLAGYIQPLSIRSYSSTRDLVKPGTYGWDRRPLNHCLLVTQPRHCTSPLNKYLCAFFFVSASCSSYSKRLSLSHSTITRRRSPHVLWYHISCEITASIVVLHLAGCIYPLPIRSYSSTRDLVKTRYGLLGSLTPEPLFVNDPTPPLHLTLNEYLYDLSWSCKKLLFIISTFLRHYIHRRTPHLPSFSHFPRPPPSPHS